MSLREFLVRAKLQTYASSGERDERQLEDGGKELTFRDGEYLYCDRYYGFNPFAGEEVVWQDGQAVWAMNYYGEVTDDAIPCVDVYGFLQSALQKVQTSRPFRGPRQFSDGDFVYRDESTGDLDRFNGHERILYQGREIYRLEYHGGVVSHAQDL